ncbi:hypothetical protein [Sphingomonas bacterium]|uniref:hypothetical protein n=1 Tax=Sphingomonas bacterium TaxID=1895847 RepID=UPI001577754A|nr:hypothetical protein [Sphingomonas bacterium]
MTAQGGDNMIAVLAGANAQLAPDALTPDQFRGKRVVLCQLEVPVATTLRAAELARDAGWSSFSLPRPRARYHLSCSRGWDG